MENFVIERKNGFDFSSVSSHSKVFNPDRLRVHALACNLFNWFRCLAPAAKTRNQTNEIDHLEMLKCPRLTACNITLTISESLVEKQGDSAPFFM